MCVPQHLSFCYGGQYYYQLVLYSKAVKIMHISKLKKILINEANMLVQHRYPTLLDATCWPRLNTMLDDVGLSLNLLKIFVKHCATLLAQQCCTVLSSFEQAFTWVVPYLSTCVLAAMHFGEQNLCCVLASSSKSSLWPC